VEASVAGDEEQLVAGAMDDEETEDEDMLVEDDEGMLGDAEISDDDDLLTVDDEGTMLMNKDLEASQVIHPISRMVRPLAYYLIF
jgi:phosphopantothenoylcysteine synthetase/decarboxylase